VAFLTFAALTIQSATVPQPLTGSWISAGLSAPTDVPITITLGTASVTGSDASNLFRAGQEAWLINVDGSGAESVIVGAVSANTLTLNPKHLSTRDAAISPVTQYPHASGAFGTGTFIAPHLQVNSAFVQGIGGAGGAYLYIGNAYNMTANYRLIAAISKVASGVQPYFWNSTESSPGNPFISSELWILGGAGLTTDSYSPSFNVA
jgi:hypothetical protein